MSYKQRNRKFCNASCSALYHKVGSLRKKDFANCLYCNEQLTRTDTTYCSNNCQQEYAFQESINNWSKENQISSHKIKRHLLKKYDNKCQTCGWGKLNSYTKSVPLDLHHIDGDSDNNSPDNVELLCPNCHSLTDNYKGANKESSRKNRKYGAPIQNRTEIG